MGPQSTSQKATRPRGIPRSGRGKQLTPSQEAALISICQAQQREQDLSNHKKSFWKTLSTELLETTGRVYSWQSCRRRMLAWETDRLSAAASTTLPPNEHSSADYQPTRPLHLSNTSLSIDGQFTNRQETDQSPSLHSPSQNQSSFANRRMAPVAGSRNHELSPSRDSDFDFDEATDDELLPEGPIPPLQRSLSTKRAGNHSPHGEVLATFKNNMTAFETQLRYFTGVVLMDKEDREGLTEAFHVFREKVDRVMKKHNPRGATARR